MKKAIACAAVLFALMGITEFHRINYIKECHDRGTNTYASTNFYFFNECGYEDLTTGKYVRLP